VRFESPQHLWALLAVVALGAGALFLQTRAEDQFRKFAQKKLWKWIAPEYSATHSRRKIWIWIFSLVFFVLAWARPQWGMREEKIKLAGLDVVVVLDVSLSMEVEDVSPSRLSKSKHFIRGILEGLKGDRVGLMAFAGSASMASPLTNDMSYVAESLELLSPRFAGLQGTNIALGLEGALRVLDRGTQPVPQGMMDPSGSRAIVLISDGEEHEPEAAALAKRIKEAGIKLYVFGVGTSKGGPIPIRDPEGRLISYKKDSSGKTVTSSFKPDALTSIALSGGGTYWNMSDTESEAQEMLKDLGALERGNYAEKTFLIYHERYQIPLAIALFLLMIEMSLAGYRTVRSAAMGLVVFFWLSPVSAQASVIDGVTTYQKNNEGVSAFEKGDLDEAAKKFGEAQALQPEKSELRFNEATTRAKKGDLEGGIQNLQSAAQEAIKNNQGSLAAKSLFNLGVALGQKGDRNSAIQAYLSSLNEAQKTKDDALIEDIRKNIELLVRQDEEKKKQKQKSDQQDKNQSSNQDKDQNQEQQQDQQKDQDQNKDQQAKSEKDKDKDKDKQDQSGENEKEEKKQSNNKDVQDPEKSRQKYQFNSKKLSKEDAEQVMAELGSKEKDLRDRMNRTSNRGQPRREQKDW